MFRPLGGGRQWLVCVVVALVAGLTIVGSAQADPPPQYEPPSPYLVPPPEPPLQGCPEAPEPVLPPEEVEGEETPPPTPDPVLVELRLQRIEAVEICEAMVARADQQIERQGWMVSELSRLYTWIDKLWTRLDEFAVESCKNPCGVYWEGQAKPVEVESLEEGAGGEPVDVAALVSSVDASGEASKSALWFLAAVLLIGIVAYPLYQAFIFWRRDV